MRLRITGIEVGSPDRICVPVKGEHVAICALHSHVLGASPAPVVRGVLLLDGETEVSDLVGREITL